MKKIVAIFAYVAVALALVGCQSKASNSFTAELEGNPTTGYTWQYTIETENIVKEMSNEYIPSDTTGKLVGAGGLYRYTFAGVSEGTVEVNFIYQRNAEHEIPIKEVIYVLAVDADNNVTLIEQREKLTADEAIELLTNYLVENNDEVAENLSIGLEEIVSIDNIKHYNFRVSRLVVDEDGLAHNSYIGNYFVSLDDKTITEKVD